MNIKKLMSFLLSAVMIFTLVPTAAFAEGDAGDTVESTTYTLKASTSADGQYEELSNNELKFNQNETVYLKIYNGETALSDYTNVTFPTIMDVTFTAVNNSYVEVVSTGSSGYYQNQTVIVNGSNLSLTVDIQTVSSGNPPSTSVYTLHESADTTGTYTAISSGVLTLSLGQTKYIKMDNGTGYISDHSSVSVSGHNTNSVTVTPQADYIVVTASETNTSNSAVTFADGDNSVVIDISVLSNSSSSGGTTPPALSISVEYATAPDGEWTLYTGSNIDFDASVNEKMYIRTIAYINGVSSVADNIKVNYTVNPGALAQPTFNSTSDYVEVSPGTINGMSSVSVSYTVENLGTATSGFNFNIKGIHIDAEQTSNYENAVVKQVAADSGKVEIGAVNGELTTNASGFTIENGKLYFDTTGKTAGNYDAAVGTQLYTAVIFPAVNKTEFTARAVEGKEVAQPVPAQYSNLPGPYVCLNYNQFNDNYSYTNGSMTSLGTLVEGGKEYLTPVYLCKVQNGNIVSMTENAVSGGNYKDYWTVEPVTLEGGIAAYKLMVDVTKIKKATTITGAIYVIGDTQVEHTVQLVASSPDDVNVDKYGFADNTSIVTNQDFHSYVSNYATVRPGNINVGGATGKQTFYIVKFTGANPTVAAYALYDEIDISSLNVQTSDGDFVEIVEYVTQTTDGKNAIGFVLDIKDTSVDKLEEIYVSFNTKAGEGETVKNLYSYGSLVCNPANPEATEVTVNNVEDFLYYYRTSVNPTVIYLESGTYSFDFVHNRDNVKVFAKEGATVILNGSDDVTKPVMEITIGNCAQYGGFIVDGRNKTKTGIAANEHANLYLGDVVIRNCDIGAYCDNYNAFYCSDATFENNKIGIVTGHPNANITNNIFDGNDIGILQKACVSVAKIKNNVFKNNTVDLQTEVTDTIRITQNYFDKAANGGVPAIKGKVYGTSTAVTPTVYYAPYYTDEAKTILAADLAGAEPATIAARTVVQNLTLPVDLTVNEATKFDNRLFNEMKSTDDKVAVEIPVTEGIETGDNQPPKTKVTTIWGFDNNEGNIAATLPADGMDLKVTSVPSSEAETIVENTVENIDDIVQYVNFSHDGTLPGKATVKVLASEVSDVSELKLYYINETTGAVETAEICDVELVEIDGEKYYVVTVDHCSEYIITTGVVAKDNSSEGETGGDDTTGGETGGSASGIPEPSPTPSVTPTTAPEATPAPTKKPTATSTTDPAVNDFVSAVEISDKLENANTSEVIVDVTDKNLVSPKAFELLAEQPEKTIVFKGEEYSISFAGKDLTDPDVLGDKTFDATVSLESPNKAKIEAAAEKAAKAIGIEKAELIHVYFSHHGKLPGKATVRVFAGTEHAGLEKHVHYFNSEDNSFEYISTITVDASGWAEFTIEHCSDYVLSDVILDTSVITETEEPTTEKEDAQQTVTEPEENKSSPLPIIIIIAVVVIAAAVMLLKKKTKKD